MARWIVLMALLLGWLMPGSARAADLEAGSVTILPPVNLSEFPTLQALQEARLPAADRYEIARRLRGLTIIPSVRTRPEPRLEGERQSFQVVNTAENRVFAAEAELLAIGEHIYVWVEPGYGVTQAAAQRFADGFDTQVYEQVRALWGSEPSPGIDGDPRIYALFVAGINPGVAAYYTSQHAYPAAVVGESNEHEMIFFNLAALGSFEIVTRLSIVRWGSEGFARLAAGSSDVLLNIVVLALLGAAFFGISLYAFYRRQDI